MMHILLQKGKDRTETKRQAVFRELGPPQLLHESHLRGDHSHPQSSRLRPPQRSSYGEELHDIRLLFL